MTGTLTWSDALISPRTNSRRLRERTARPSGGDVLFSKDGTVGKVYVVDTRETFAVLSSLAILRPDASRLDASYFGRVLKTDSCLDQASQSKTGSAIRRIILKDLKRVRFPLPPLAEQKRIAAILDAADALRAKRRETLAQLDTLLQSTFLDMFGDPVTNPMGWDTFNLEQVGQVITGNTPSRKRPEYYGDDIEWIKSDNINDPSVFLTEAEERLSVAGKAVARTTPKGSILVTCIAGSPACIGNAANRGIEKSPSTSRSTLSCLASVLGLGSPSGCSWWANDLFKVHQQMP